MCRHDRSKSHNSRSYVDMAIKARWGLPIFIELYDVILCNFRALTSNLNLLEPNSKFLLSSSYFQLLIFDL